MVCNEVKSVNQEQDAELWSQAASGSAEAEEQLIGRYSRLVKICSRPFFLAGGDSEDLMQEGMIGLLSAVRHYDPARNVKFKTFAEFCIRRRIISAVRSAACSKNIPLNDYVSFESPQFDESNASASYSFRDPENLVIAREHFREITSGSFIKQLSGFESQIMWLYLDGLSYEEIAARVGKPMKSVDNAVQRIRRKLTQYLNTGDIQETERK